MTFTNQCIYCILTNQNLPGVGILKLGNLKQFSKALLLQQFSQQPQFFTHLSPTELITNKQNLYLSNVLYSNCLVCCTDKHKAGATEFLGENFI